MVEIDKYNQKKVAMMVDIRCFAAFADNELF